MNTETASILETGDYTPGFVNKHEFIKWKQAAHRERLVKNYDYVLSTPNLLGNVDGEYLNWSRNLSSVKRKLKRLLRCRKLNIIYVDSTYGEWCDAR